MIRALLATLILAIAAPAAAQSPEQWIEWGERVHGGFGTLIALGIRVGLDAQNRLGAARRELDVTYYDGTGTPCPCVADGALIATSASPGQGTLRIAQDKAAPGMLAEIVFRHRKTGATTRYRISMEVMPRMAQWNKTLDARGRYDAVMAADASTLYAAE